MIAGPIITPFLVVTGLALGSFCANLALRSARGEQALVGPSRCEACLTPLNFARTTPVISFIALRGACADCGARIDPAHLMGEVGGGVIVLAALQSPSPVRAALLAVMGFALLTTAIIDLKTQRLPDGLTLIVAASAALLAALASPAATLESVTAGFTVFAVLETVRRAYQKMRGRSGLGFGDVKLLSALALWLGLATPWAVVLASILGLGAFAAFKPKGGRIAFGPTIALAAWTVGIVREAGLWPI